MLEYRDDRWTRAICTRAVSTIALCLVTLVLTGGKSCAGGVADGELTLFLAGDTIITQPWSNDRDPRFLALVDEIRGADVAAVNLEMLFHEYGATRRPTAAAATWPRARRSPPNSPGPASTWSPTPTTTPSTTAPGRARKPGQRRPGRARARRQRQGPQAARAPAYFAHPDGTVALVSTASTFTPYGGVPLASGPPRAAGPQPVGDGAGAVPRAAAVRAHAAWGVAEILGLPRRRLDDEWFELFGVRMRGGSRRATPRAEDRPGRTWRVTSPRCARPQPRRRTSSSFRSTRTIRREGGSPNSPIG